MPKQVAEYCSLDVSVLQLFLRDRLPSASQTLSLVNSELSVVIVGPIQRSVIPQRLL